MKILHRTLINYVFRSLKHSSTITWLAQWVFIGYINTNLLHLVSDWSVSCRDSSFGNTSLYLDQTLVDWEDNMNFDLSLFKEFLKDPTMSIVSVSPLTGKQEYTCPKCCKVYTYPSTLHRHLKFECGKQPQFKCPHCLYRAHRKDNIKAHIIGKHGKNYSF